MDVHSNPWVVTSERQSFGAFHSLGAFYKVVGHKRIYNAFERPPFPIIIDKPSVHDIVSEMRFSDFFMFGTVYSVGLGSAYWMSRHVHQMIHRTVVFHWVSHMFFTTAVAALFVVPFRRLTGYWDNGLRWRKPDDKLKKYDQTSVYERSTGWDRFRIKTE